MKVSVSILKECNRLDYAIKKVNESSADFLHVDVMDGKFVKSLLKIKPFCLKIIKR